jgi:hypothetical protein
MASTAGQPIHVGNVLQITTMIHRDRGELEEALRDSREAVRILEPTPGSTGLSKSGIMNYAIALTREAEILGGDDAISMGRPDDAIAPLRRAFEIAEGIAQQNSSDANSRIPLSMAGIMLGGILRASDPAGALAAYDQTLHRIGEIKNNPRFRRDEVQSLAGSSYALRALGRNAEARKRLDDAFSRLSGLKLYPAEQVQAGSEVQKALIALAEYEAGTGNPSRGIEIYRDLLDRVLAAKPSPQSHLRDALALSDIYGRAAKLNRQAGQLDAASGLDARRLEIWQIWNIKLPNNDFVSRQIEAVSLSEVSRSALHTQPIDILNLNRSLETLAREDADLAQLIELRYFGGMTAEETAEAVGRSVHVIRHDLRLAHAWLRRELDRDAK